MSNFPQLTNPCKVTESDFDPDIAELLAMIPKSEFKRVYGDYYSEYTPIPSKQHGFIGFIENYKHIAAMIPKNWTIIDFGAASGVQGYYFKDHAKYIAVEPSTIDGRPFAHFHPNNADWYDMSAKEFIDMVLPRLDLNMETTFAICNYVPSEIECNALVRSVFPRCFIFYPCDPEISVLL